MWQRVQRQSRITDSGSLLPTGSSGGAEQNMAADGSVSHPSSSALPPPPPRQLRGGAARGGRLLPADSHDRPEDQPLFLPSTLTVPQFTGCTNASGLKDLEKRLREGQLRSSLDKLRVHLHIKTRLMAFKGRNVRHQGPTTRARKKINSNEAKIIAYAEKYRAARRAMVALVGPGDWESEWRVLDRRDVRCLKDDDPETALPTSEGHRQLSWIWRAAGQRDEDGDIGNMGEGELHAVLVALPHPRDNRAARAMATVPSTYPPVQGRDQHCQRREGACAHSTGPRSSAMGRAPRPDADALPGSRPPAGRCCIRCQPKLCAATKEGALQCVMGHGSVGVDDCCPCHPTG